MGSRVTVDRAGRILLPKAVRKDMHLEAGDKLEIEATGQEITLRPIPDGPALIKKRGVWVLRGTGPISTAETNAVVEQIRREREEGLLLPE
jgi:AbrB family looped-hinge helix DNA binding protein